MIADEIIEPKAQAESGQGVQIGVPPTCRLVDHGVRMMAQASQFNGVTGNAFAAKRRRVSKGTSEPLTERARKAQIKRIHQFHK